LESEAKPRMETKRTSAVKATKSKAKTIRTNKNFSRNPSYKREAHKGPNTMTNEEIIKNYLEEQCKTDSALAAKYNASKMHDLMNAIMEKSRKIAVKNAAMVKSEIVFKWARDFFIDGDFEASKSDNEITEAIETAKIKGTGENSRKIAEMIAEAEAKAKAEALKEFREEAKKKAEEAAAQKAAEKAAREAEKAAAKAKIAAEQSNVISLF